MIKEEDGFDEPTAFYYFIQACAGTYFLHRNGVMHRDLKPENLLVTRDNVLKLCDFGGSISNEKERNTFCGTYEYMAPEMVRHIPHG